VLVEVVAMLVVEAVLVVIELHQGSLYLLVLQLQ
jgi:hypothetical protein